jgi:hypothetical protein
MIRFCSAIGLFLVLFFGQIGVQARKQVILEADYVLQRVFTVYLHLLVLFLPMGIWLKTYCSSNAGLP